MARCNCTGQTCGCRLIAGAGVAVEGSGTAADPWVVSAAGGGGADGWFPGDLKDTTSSETPAGWLEANGQAVSRTSFPALFAEIGTQWGAGDGFSTFNVPDLRGRFRVGAGPGFALAASGGAAAVTLTTAQIPGHVHTIAHAHAMGNHTHAMGDHTHSINHNHTATSPANATHAHFISGNLAGNTTIGGAGTRVQDVSGGTAIGFTDNADASHAHPIANFTGSSGNPTAANTQGMTAAVATDGSNVANSGSAGGGDPVSILPPYRAVRVLVHT